MPKEMQEQIVPGSHTVNVSDGRILCAWIGRHHHVAILVSQNELSRDVALDYFVSEVPTHRVTTHCVDFEALL